MTGVDTERYLRQLDANLPAEILEQGRFLVWEGRVRPSGRMGKVPVAPSGVGGWFPINASDSRYWLDWGQAIRQLRFYDPSESVGLALVLSGSVFVAADLDDCVHRVDGQQVIGLAAQTVLGILGWPGHGYVERSPSGQGLHLLGFGNLGAGRPRKRPGVEVMDAGILTLTGDALPGSGSLTLPEGAWAALQSSWPAPLSVADRGRTARRNPNPAQRTDVQLLTKARNSRNGPKFRRLFDFGDAVSDYPSRSEGVAGLLAMLLYWTDGDLARAEQLYRQSSLYRPDLDDRPAGPAGRTRLALTLDRVSAWRRRS